MYGKLFDQMFDGTLATQGPWQALVTFQQLIILADKHGCVDMTSEAISRRTTIPLKIIEVGLKTLVEPDPKSRTPAEDGRRIVLLSPERDWGWRIVNYEHYRKIRSEEERREYHRRYYHLKRKLNTSTGAHQTQPIAVSSKQEVVSIEATTTPRSRGSRLFLEAIPENWARFCLHNRPDLNPEITFNRFHDYWVAQPGQRGVKLDWEATWRNWVRNEKKGAVADAPRRVAV